MVDDLDLLKVTVMFNGKSARPPPRPPSGGPRPAARAPHPRPGPRHSPAPIRSTRHARLGAITLPRRAGPGW
jgi:hypothetical protein